MGAQSKHRPACPEKTPARVVVSAWVPRVFLSLGYQISGDLIQAYAVMYASDEPGQSRDYQMFLVRLCVFSALARRGPVGHGTGRAPGSGDELIPPIPSNSVTLVTLSSGTYLLSMQ